MKTDRIEKSCERNRGITAEEIREGLAETKRRMAQPGYAEGEMRRLDKAKRDGKGRGIKFPSLAKRGTKPVVAGPDELLFRHTL